MDNQRLFAWALFGLLMLMTYQAWQADYGPQPVATNAEPVMIDADTPDELMPPGDTLPSLDGLTPVDAAPAADSVPTVPGTVADNPATTTLIEVTTDVLTLAINPQGGDIVSAKLAKYPVRKDAADELVTLLSPEQTRFAVFRTGLATRDRDNEPNHRAAFSTERLQYALADGEDTLVVPLRWTNAEGVTVTKSYTMRRGEYAVDLTLSIDNKSDANWLAAPYGRIVHYSQLPDRSMIDVESYSFKGPVLYDGERYQKYKIKTLAEDGNVQRDEVVGGWLAAIEHHFLTAVVPPADDSVRLQVGLSQDAFVAGYVGKPRTIAAGESLELPMTLFVGPKLQDQLRAVSERLPLTVDYGMLTLLAEPLFWLLDKVHGFVGNWGWSIIILTILIKLVFYKLTEQSGRSIAKMRNLQPRLRAIQDRYKDDRQKLSQAMMDLYKREKVNPAAGCLPILIQMPFFIAFYWVLLESVEMRQAPFMLWIQDLSSRDPFFILPVLMGVAMLIQQKMNPAPPDPVHAKVMKILPIVFTVFFAFFPAGLVLYWFTNTLLGALQQWQVNRVVAAEQKLRD
ncbi:MAG: membrane protein insertase YidC [Pseudomonadota bacterium]